MKVAEQLGFAIPRTIFSNTLRPVKKFFQSSGQKEIIYKPVGHGVLRENGDVVFTSTLKTIEISEEEEMSLRVAPGIFQEYIPKDYEVRVTVVDNLTFAAVKHSKEELPREIHDRCVHLIKELNLLYGAIDLIVTPEGEWVFLENNCNGQWLWLENLVGLEISEAIARLLIKLDKE